MKWKPKSVETETVSKSTINARKYVFLRKPLRSQKLKLLHVRNIFTQKYERETLSSQKMNPHRFPNNDINRTADVSDFVA